MLMLFLVLCFGEGLYLLPIGGDRKLLLCQQEVAWDVKRFKYQDRLACDLLLTAKYLNLRAELFHVVSNARAIVIIRAPLLLLPFFRHTRINNNKIRCPTYNVPVQHTS